MLACFANYCSSSCILFESGGVNGVCVDPVSRVCPRFHPMCAKIGSSRPWQQHKASRIMDGWMFYADHQIEIMLSLKSSLIFL